MTLLTQFKTATATAGITYPSNNVEYAATALQASFLQFLDVVPEVEVSTNLHEALFALFSTQHVDPAHSLELP